MNTLKQIGFYKNNFEEVGCLDFIFESLSNNTSIEFFDASKFSPKPIAIKDLKCLDFLETNKTLKTLNLINFSFEKDVELYFNEKMILNESIEEMEIITNVFDFIVKNKTLKILKLSSISVNFGLNISLGLENVNLLKN